MSSKKILRNRFLHMREQMPIKDIISNSEAINRKVMASLAYREAETILGYMPMHNEVDIYDLLQQALKDQKRVALPRIETLLGAPAEKGMPLKTLAMHFYLVEDLSQVSVGFYGVLEPTTTNPVSNLSQSLVLVPGVAFDLSGYRLGYGGGFYDRFLAQETFGAVVGVAYEMQMIEALPYTDTDVPIPVVVTKNHVYHNDHERTEQ